MMLSYFISLLVYFLNVYYSISQTKIKITGNTYLKKIQHHCYNISQKMNSWKLSEVSIRAASRGYNEFIGIFIMMVGDVTDTGRGGGRL